jgi:TRAP-type mannitol/chloroaromatic compound transport system permease small subunit
MSGLLAFSRVVDWVTDKIGKGMYWMVLLAVLISSGNAVVRYGLNQSSNAWLEMQWYLFSAVFLICSAYTLLNNQHIRIDIVSSRMTQTSRNWIDIIGTLFFLIPLCVLMLYEGWPYFLDTWYSGEVSTNAGGLIRWPARLLIVLGFGLLLIQALSELIKRVAVMLGRIPDPHRPTSSHGEI